MEDLQLTGTHVRLEPLELRHADALVRAAQGDPALYKWTFIPQDKAAAESYIETALAWKRADMALPFAIVRLSDGMVCGSTRFWNLERWFWPAGHASYGRTTPDACEIGYTWLSPAAMRTAVNTEAKLLLLTFAFEEWKVLRVCLHTDARNTRSRAAIEGIGGQFEGILRAHRMAADLTPRDSARYSIIAPEWPALKLRLRDRIAGGERR
jgi:RimJ/RimL family protein N-acetyltransferase